MFTDNTDILDLTQLEKNYWYTFNPAIIQFNEKLILQFLQLLKIKNKPKGLRVKLIR